MPSYAKLRPLEPIPIQAEGQQLVVLRDPARYVTNDVTVTVPVYLLLCLIDGTRSVLELQADFKEQFGGETKTEEIETLLSDLDQIGFLENERFETIRDKAIADFRDATVRGAAYAGSAYEGEPEALRTQIDGFYADMADGNQATPKGREWKGIVAPHIDPRIGGRTAAHAFAELHRADPLPDLFVLLGTSHQPSSALFTMTEKDFETPLGVAEVDHEIAQALNQACSRDLLAEEFLHKHEHSIEFQIIFLQHLFGQIGLAGGPGSGENPPIGGRNHDFRILPILVGSFGPFLQGNTLPSVADEVAEFTEALRTVLDASDRRVCFVVGADLSHMGKKFGDEEGATEALIASTRAKDREMLDHVANMRQEEFFRHLQVDEDRQKVCGLPPIYTMMHMLGETCEGRILDYDLHVEEATESFVSFASLAFYQ